MAKKDLFLKYGLTLGDKSCFFKYAKQTDKLGNLVRYVKAKRDRFKYGQILSSQFDLPNWPKKLAKPVVYSFNTPENNAVTIGRFKLDEKKLVFELPRFHTGVTAQMDLLRAMRQVVYSNQIKDIFKSIDLPEKQAYGIEFTREGHLANFQEAIYRGLNKTVPFTLVHVKHFEKGITNKYKRITMVSKITLEGLFPDEIKLAILVDSVASGMQQVAVGEYLIDQINKKTNKNKLKQLVVVAPMLNLWGAVVTSLWAASQNLEIKFITSGGLLLGPDSLKYFSTVLTDKRVASNTNLAKLHQLAHDAKSRNRACVRSNWTASFLAPEKAVSFSDNELKQYGSSNQKLLKASKKISLDLVKKMKIDLRSLIPYSTRYEAKKLGRLAELNDYLE